MALIAARLNAVAILVVTVAIVYSLPLPPPSPVPNKPYGFSGHKAPWKTNNAPRFHSDLRSCVKVKVGVLGFPSLISLMVSVDVKQDWNEKCQFRFLWTWAVTQTSKQANKGRTGLAVRRWVRKQAADVGSSPPRPFFLLFRWCPDYCSRFGGDSVASAVFLSLPPSPGISVPAGISSEKTRR